MQDAALFRQNSMPARAELPPCPPSAPPRPPASFWTRHVVLSALLHDVVLWERPVVSALFYAALVWAVMLARALVPSDAAPSSLLFFVCAALLLGALAVNWLGQTLDGSPVLALVRQAPTVLCAPPRERAQLVARAEAVERAVGAARARAEAFLCELGLAKARDEGRAAGVEGEQGGAALTVLGKALLGLLCFVLAFVTSLMSTTALFVLLLAVAAVVPPVVRYNLVQRVFDALTTSATAANEAENKKQQ